jgi:hypothetical protein
MKIDVLFAIDLAVLLGACITLALGGPDWAWAVFGAALIAAIGLAALPK